MQTKEQQTVLEKIKALGVTDPLNPSSNDMKVILDALLKKKSLDIKSFEIYQQCLSTTLSVLFDGLKAFSKDGKEISLSTHGTINRAISILETEIVRDHSVEERKEIREQVFKLVIEARKEAIDNRWHIIYVIGCCFAGVAIIIIAIILFIPSRGKTKEMLIAGGKLLVRA